MSRIRPRLFSKKQTRTVKRNFKKHGLLALNAAIIVAVTGFIWVGHNSASSGDSSSNAVALLGQKPASNTSGPLDNLSSADIAANIALAAKLPEKVMVVNQADSFKAQLIQANTEESVVTKPQVVTGASISKNDIKSYVAVEGDTVTSVAERYGVSKDSVKWSNSISVENIPSGKELKIPPANGMVYVVAEGDTVDSLATKYRTSKEKIVTINDIELTGLKVGDTIFMADAQPPVTRAVVSAVATSNNESTVGFIAKYGGNGYYYGYCTWYAANRVPVPSNWGNANTWDNRARSSGWTVSKVPVPGAVAQTDAMSWWGHVAVVEAVSPDGTMIKYSDMNGLAGFGRVGYSDWVPASTYQNYIYR